jgi:hypothetical protein
VRIRWRFTIIWTGVCLVVLASFVDTIRMPIPAGCWEYCGLNADIARAAFPWVLLVWLTVTLVAAWLWARATTVRCPSCGQRVVRDAERCPGCAHDMVASGEPDPPHEPD